VQYVLDIRNGMYAGSWYAGSAVGMQAVGTIALSRSAKFCGLY